MKQEDTGDTVIETGKRLRAACISVVIGTRNRPSDLVLCLQSLAKQDHPSYEVVVVDQSTSEEARIAVREAIGDPAWLQLIPSPTVGRSNALNIALETCSSDIIAFTDDDCAMPTDWVSRIDSFFNENPEVDIVTGPVHAGSAKGAKGPVYFPSLYFTERRVVEVGEVAGMGANMAFRRSIIKKVGGFDPYLGTGAFFQAGEDTDLVYRCQLAGSAAVREPSLTITHLAWRSLDEWNKVLYKYGFGDAAYGMKHVRCRDWAMARRTFGQAAYIFARLMWRLICRHPHQEQYYLHGFWDGVKASRRWVVDTKTRLYCEKA